MDYGIKISKPGYDVKFASPSQLVYSSAYNLLKVYKRGDGVLKDSTGRSVQIYHGLGYVPQYILHTQQDKKLNSYIGNYLDFFVNPSLPGASGCGLNNRSIKSKIDDSYLYLEAGENMGFEIAVTDADQYNYSYRSTKYGWSSGYFFVGDTSSYGVEDGSYRFVNVPIYRNQSIISASLGIAINSTTGTGRIFGRIYGIAEDNTGSFTGDPFGRPRTSSYHDFEIGSGRQVGDIIYIDVTSAFREIISRSGWNYGNAMGFLIFNNGSDFDNEIGDAYYVNSTCSDAKLKVLTQDKLAEYKYTIFENKIV